MLDKNQLPRLIDLSSVRAECTMDELNQLVALAKKYQFICTYSMPCFIPWMIEQLKDEPNVMVGGTVGFPSGADLTEMKVYNAKLLREAGCGELDMVINVGALRSGMYDFVLNDIRAVVDAAEGLPVKVILEVAHLTDDEIRRGSELVVEAGAAFVKTGTGWCSKPTTVEHIKLIRSTIGDAAKIKAAGGVRDLQTIEAMVEAGCSRFGIGTNSGVKLLKEVGLWED